MCLSLQLYRLILIIALLITFKVLIKRPKRGADSNVCIIQEFSDSMRTRPEGAFSFDLNKTPTHTHNYYKTSEFGYLAGRTPFLAYCSIKDVELVFLLGQSTI